MSRHDLQRPPIHYPDSDGQPMAETELHRDVMLDLIVSARHHFRARADVHVTGNLLLYFVEGDPKKCVSPDFFLVRGIAKRRRRIFKLWEELRGPELVVEITSPKTHRVDLGRKRELYESLGVSEYFLVDPEGLQFDPPLRGFRRGETGLDPITAERREDGTLVLVSEIADLELHARGDHVRWVDSATGAPILVPHEVYRAFDEARARERNVARHAEAERERAEAERERAEAERERAEAERERAEAERERAEAERERADAIALENQRLHAELARWRAGPNTPSGDS